MKIIFCLPVTEKNNLAAKTFLLGVNFRMEINNFINIYIYEFVWCQ